MDTELLRTFLEVNRTRHFGQAADNLFVTQSAVSSRIRLLEQIIGVPLFSRTRGDIQLTPGGSKLLRHAENIIISLNRARQEISIDNNLVSPMVVGSVPNIWDSVLQNWLYKIYTHRKNISLTTEISSAEALLSRVNNGTMDLALLFSSPQVSELLSIEIGNVPLILVSTKKDQTVEEATSLNYVKVDWGTPFDIVHAREFPDIPPPIAQFALGQYAHQFILNCGGSAYLAEPSIVTDLDKGNLYRVNDAPTMTRTAYAVYSSKSVNKSTIEECISYLDVPTKIDNA